MISKTVIAAGILLLGFGDGLSQNLTPGGELPTLTEEQKLARLQDNFNAMVVAFITYAGENDSSVSEAGFWLGKLMARSWGDDLTPERFVSGMNRNWQMMNIKTEILEATPNRVKAKRTMMMTDEEFQNMFSPYDVRLSDFQEFFSAAQKGITQTFGLTYSEVAEGNALVFTVASGEK